MRVLKPKIDEIRKKSRTGSEKKRSLKNRESVRKPEKGRAARRKR
jgi:hypothetical protein